MPLFTLAFASSSHVTAAFVGGLVDLWGSPLKGAVASVVQIQSGPTLAHARDTMTRAFLEHSDAPVLVMVDCDMAWRAAHVAVLLALTAQAGVVGAKYNGQVPGSSEIVPEAGAFIAGVFKPIELANDQAELVDVDVIGAGLIAIRREVFVDIAKLPPGEPMPWWSEAVRDGGYVEEDFEFCLRAKAAGHRVALAAGVQVPHMKMVPI